MRLSNQTIPLDLNLIIEKEKDKKDKQILYVPLVHEKYNKLYTYNAAEIVKEVCDTTSFISLLELSNADNDQLLYYYNSVINSYSSFFTANPYYKKGEISKLTIKFYTEYGVIHVLKIDNAKIRDLVVNHLIKSDLLAYSRYDSKPLTLFTNKFLDSLETNFIESGGLLPIVAGSEGGKSLLIQLLKAMRIHINKNNIDISQITSNYFINQLFNSQLYTVNFHEAFEYNSQGTRDEVINALASLGTNEILFIDSLSPAIYEPSLLGKFSKYLGVSTDLGIGKGGVSRSFQILLSSLSRYAMRKGSIIITAINPMTQTESTENDLINDIIISNTPYRINVTKYITDDKITFIYNLHIRKIGLDVELCKLVLLRDKNVQNIIHISHNIDGNEIFNGPYVIDYEGSLDERYEIIQNQELKTINANKSEVYYANFEKTPTYGLYYSKQMRGYIENEFGNVGLTIKYSEDVEETKRTLKKYKEKLLSQGYTQMEVSQKLAIINNYIIH